MRDTTSRLFLLGCLLAAVWIVTYWLYEPAGAHVTRDTRVAPPNVVRTGDQTPPPKPVQPPPQPKVDPPPPAPPAPPVETTKVKPPTFHMYTVQKGDTFESIAQHFFGDPKKGKAISNMNPMVSPDRLKAGRTELMIPDDPDNIQGVLVKVQEPPPKATSTEKVPRFLEQPDPPPAPAGRTYTIKEDDTLWDISKKMYGKGSLWTKIFEANKDVISDPDRLPKAGTALKIPPQQD